MGLAHKAYLQDLVATAQNEVEILQKLVLTFQLSTKKSNKLWYYSNKSWVPKHKL